MEFLFENKSSLLFALGAVIMIVILMRRWNRYYRKRRPAKGAARHAALAAGDRQQPLLDAPPEILRWQVEMHETARDLKAELDTKISVLQRLVIDAQIQADRLEGKLNRADNTAASGGAETP